MPVYFASVFDFAVRNIKNKYFFMIIIIFKVFLYIMKRQMKALVSIQCGT